MPNLMPGMPVRKESMFSMQLSKSAMAVNRPMTLTFFVMDDLLQRTVPSIFLSGADCISMTK